MNAIKYYWEDFPLGSTRDCGEATLTTEEIVQFARQYDPQPFHVDEAAATASKFGGIIASGMHTMALANRMICDAYLLETAGLGSPGLEYLKFLKPVRPGDTLHLTMIVEEARVLQSKPDVGLLRSHWKMFNQKNECVLEMEGYLMCGRRPPQH
ncbi:MAG: MaoC family dehydratase [Georgfuchsia sp.]